MKNFLLFMCALLIFACAEQPSKLEYDSVIPESEKMVARGEVLFAVGACGSCHENGVKNLSTVEFNTRIRTGSKGNGEKLSYTHPGSEWISDIDLISLQLYIQKVNGVVSTDRSSATDQERTVRQFVPSVRPTQGKIYGKYLVDHVARCGSCHSTPETFWSSEKYLSGNDRITNIKALDWSEEQLVHFLTSGEKPSGEHIERGSCPVESYRKAPALELNAIAAYIRSIQSKE